MPLLAPHLTAFMADYLPHHRGVSRHTRDAYAYTFTMLLSFASRQLQTPPSSLQLEQVDTDLVTAFLEHLEIERGNTARSRNARLAAIRSFVRFLEYRVPECLEQLRRLLAIPMKLTDEGLVTHLTRPEMQAILDAPDPRTRKGLRDRAMLHLAFAAGLRVSELVGLTLEDLVLDDPPTVRVQGKGRRERILPLWRTTTCALRAWLRHRQNSDLPQIFLNAHGEAITRAGFAYVLQKYAKAATSKQPSLGNKKISPHVLRHTCAMHTLEATGDIRKVALWLGHASVESTEIYTRSDPAEKLDAIQGVKPPTLWASRFRAVDQLLASLRPVPQRKRYVK